jgi:hypothetical protein
MAFQKKLFGNVCMYTRKSNLQEKKLFISLKFFLKTFLLASPAFFSHPNIYKISSRTSYILPAPIEKSKRTIGYRALNSTQTDVAILCAKTGFQLQRSCRITNYSSITSKEFQDIN